MMDEQIRIFYDGPLDESGKPLPGGTWRWTLGPESQGGFATRQEAFEDAETKYPGRGIG